MDTQNQLAKTPLSDLRQDALKHYLELAQKAHHWSSFVEHAIKAYNPDNEPVEVWINPEIRKPDVAGRYFVKTKAGKKRTCQYHSMTRTFSTDVAVWLDESLLENVEKLSLSEEGFKNKFIDSLEDWRIKISEEKGISNTQHRHMDRTIVLAKLLFTRMWDEYSVCVSAVNWVEALTNVPVRVHPMTENYFISNFIILKTNKK